jgi:DNA repair exonuclease SbcCD ATPase subunit
LGGIKKIRLIEDFSGQKQQTTLRVVVMSEFQDEHDELLDLEQTPSAEELQNQVKRAQSELLQLRQRQDQIEKEKERLEELTRRQEDLERGRNEIADKLTRSIILVQRETEEAQRRLEQLNNIQDSFAEHLRNLEEINPKSWHGRDLPRELTRALGTVDEARSAYARSHAKIAPIEDVDGEVSISAGGYFPEVADQGFAYWLRSGLAFTLPLLALGTITLFIWIWHLMTAAR